MEENTQKLVFVVDDNDVNLLMVASLLESEYEVLTMQSAERMFLLLKKKRPNLILLDVEMPEMNGLDAIAILKENPDLREIPVLFLTGWEDEELTSDALKRGALAVISKPIVPSLLLDSVKKYLLE